MFWWLTESKTLIIIAVLDIIIWIITYKLMVEWLNYVYKKTGYNCEVRFGMIVMEGFAFSIPGIILLIDQICTKSFRDYMQKSIKNESFKKLLFRV
jgi:hypothetical protein